MKNNSIISIKPLGLMWLVSDPFLFCAHHHDYFPAGNDKMEPDVIIAGRNIGQDFSNKDGWSMYHGKTIPGFPAHPHRGFETVTIVLKGTVDHADSLGQSGRYGNGDVQWMTAGEGLQHSEMFPLLNQEAENPTELFQVWLNLPKSKKFVKPYFKMLWSEDIPVCKIKDKNGNLTEVKVISGSFAHVKSPQPTPDSWAADAENEVAIWTIKMDSFAEWTIPSSDKRLNRNLYFYRGSTLTIDETEVISNHSIEIRADAELRITNGNSESSFLLLQGKPIKEPVVQYGPFVMNSEAEIQQAFTDYKKTEFGGWPWPLYDQVHSRSTGRFAKYANGEIDKR